MNFKKLISLFAIVLFLVSGSIFATNESDDEGTSSESSNVEDLLVQELKESKLAKLIRPFFVVGDKIASIASGGYSVAKKGSSYFCPNHWISEESRVGKILNSGPVKGCTRFFCPATLVKESKESLVHAWEVLKFLKSGKFKEIRKEGWISSRHAALAILSAVAIVHGIDATLLLASNFGFDINTDEYCSGMLTMNTYNRCAEFIAITAPTLWSQLIQLGGQENNTEEL